MLVQIKNAQAVGSEQVSVPFSKVKFMIAKLLNEGGFVGDVEKRKKKTVKSEFEYISIILKYDGKNPVISGFKIISKPSRHMYIRAGDIKPVRSGYGLGVISTPRGIMSS